MVVLIFKVFQSVQIYLWIKETIPSWILKLLCCLENWAVIGHKVFHNFLPFLTEFLIKSFFDSLSRSKLVKSYVERLLLKLICMICYMLIPFVFQLVFGKWHPSIFEFIVFSLLVCIQYKVRNRMSWPNSKRAVFIKFDVLMASMPVNHLYESIWMRTLTLFCVRHFDLRYCVLIASEFVLIYYFFFY